MNLSRDFEYVGEYQHCGYLNCLLPKREHKAQVDHFLNSLDFTEEAFFLEFRGSIPINSYYFFFFFSLQPNWIF